MHELMLKETCFRRPWGSGVVVGCVVVVGISVVVVGCGVVVGIVVVVVGSGVVVVRGSGVVVSSVVVGGFNVVVVVVVIVVVVGGWVVVVGGSIVQLIYRGQSQIPNVLGLVKSKYKFSVSEIGAHCNRQVAIPWGEHSQNLLQSHS